MNNLGKELLLLAVLGAITLWISILIASNNDLQRRVETLEGRSLQANYRITVLENKK